MQAQLCKKCGLPLAFKKLASGKLCPVNPDGSDHWDLCRGVTRDLDSAITRCIQERGLSSSGRPTHVYTGDVPPWDESLGAFRDFTADEIAAGVVCAPLAARKPTRFTRQQLAAKWRS